MLRTLLGGRSVFGPVMRGGGRHYDVRIGATVAALFEARRTSSPPATGEALADAIFGPVDDSWPRIYTGTPGA